MGKDIKVQNGQNRMKAPARRKKFEKEQSYCQYKCNMTAFQDLVLKIHGKLKAEERRLRMHLKDNYKKLKLKPMNKVSLKRKIILKKFFNQDKDGATEMNTEVGRNEEVGPEQNEEAGGNEEVGTTKEIMEKIMNGVIARLKKMKHEKMSTPEELEQWVKQMEKEAVIYNGFGYQSSEDEDVNTVEYRQDGSAIDTCKSNSDYIERLWEEKEEVT